MNMHIWQSNKLLVLNEINVLPVINCAGMIDAHEIVVEVCEAGVLSDR